LVLEKEMSERSKRNHILVPEMLLKPKTEVEFATLQRELTDDEMKFNMHFRYPAKNLPFSLQKYSAISQLPVTPKLCLLLLEI
jgi:hypothetical protein